jgi:hypothetical protein
MTTHKLTAMPNPALVSTRLPMELVENVIREIDDPSTLAAMMRVSHRTYKVAAPLLYRKVAIHGNNLGLLHVGVDDRESDAKSIGCHNDRKGDCGDLFLETGKLPWGTQIDRADQVDHHDQDIPHISNDSTAFAKQPFRTSKAKLLTLVRHVDIYDIPPIRMCNDVLSLAQDGTASRYLSPTTVSIRPIAAWKLMKHDMKKKKDGPPHPLLTYLETLGSQHLCIQFPLIDQHVEDSLVPGRQLMPRNYSDISGVRMTLRDAFLKSKYCNGSVKDLFGFSRLHCPTVTIHNLTMILTDRAFAGLTETTTTVRIFYRPCTGSDGEVKDKDKIWDHYCYGHCPDNNRRIADPTPSPAVLSSPQNAEFIDMDWVSGKYDPLRDNKSLQLAGGLGSENWGKKSFKMANEVDACRCCGKHQLSAVEVSTSGLSQETTADIQSSIGPVVPK